MKTTSNTNDPSRDDAVTRELLLLADRQEIEPPRDLLDRVRARLHENTVRSHSVPMRGGQVHVFGRPLPGKMRLLAEKWTSPRTKRAWFAGAGAAAVVLIALLFSLQPSSVAWSQVVEATRAMPWIHIKMEAVGGKGESRETWISFSRNIGAVRDGNLVSYDDYRSGIGYEYDSQKKKLFRLSAPDHGAKELKSGEGVFQAILRGDAIRTEDLFGPFAIKQRQRTVT